MLCLACFNKQGTNQNCFNLGHKIEEIPEVPLIVSDKIQEYTKTKQAVQFLRKVKAWSDIQKVSECCFY